VWTHHEDEWKKLLAPFRKGEEKGNVVIVTTRSPEVGNMVKTIDYPIEMGRLEAAGFMKLNLRHVYLVMINSHGKAILNYLMLETK
jgi:hypothetical protein